MLKRMLTHHRLFLLLSQDLFQKRYCLPLTIHLIVNSFVISNKTPFVHKYALNSPALSYCFNFEEYVFEIEISSPAISSQEILSDETKNQLKDMLPMLERNIANLVQDADPIRRIFLAIKDDLPPNLAKALIPLSNIEDQAPKVKKAQRNLMDREAWLRRTLTSRKPKNWHN